MRSRLRQQRRKTRHPRPPTRLGRPGHRHPSALDFIDTKALEAQTGHPVRSEYRKPDRPRSPRPDAIIVAPATYNTINKWTNGISDTYALGILAEAPGPNIPLAVLPLINTALASRRALKHSILTLQAERVRILLGPGKFEPHPPRGGGSHWTPSHGRLGPSTQQKSPPERPWPR
ncbi:flavoprotein [Actinomadura graeca]|uniref:flavoprotein n=1 Tax=Actinomadura graeca TaxID=2750812 RepID=UPI001E28A393|nr:flavoprotein [Actinomadura graeca]